MRLAPGKRVLTEEEERFKHALLEAVDEGLGVLGQDVKATIYFHVEKRGSLCREEIPEKLQAFTRALREIFGVGGPVIERLIAKRLLHNLELAYNERRDYGLIEYVEEAKAALRRRSRCQEPTTASQDDKHGRASGIRDDWNYVVRCKCGALLANTVTSSHEVSSSNRGTSNRRKAGSLLGICERFLQARAPGPLSKRFCLPRSWRLPEGDTREVPLAFVMITAEIGREGEVLNELKKIDHVREACLTYGVYDIVAMIEAETWDKLKEVITSKVRRLSSVRSTLTMMVMEGT